jgi:hypothetical protein
MCAYFLCQIFIISVCLKSLNNFLILLKLFFRLTINLHRHVTHIPTCFLQDISGDNNKLSLWPPRLPDINN